MPPYEGLFARRVVWNTSNGARTSDRGSECSKLLFRDAARHEARRKYFVG